MAIAAYATNGAALGVLRHIFLGFVVGRRVRRILRRRGGVAAIYFSGALRNTRATNRGRLFRAIIANLRGKHFLFLVRSRT